MPKVSLYHLGATSRKILSVPKNRVGTIIDHHSCIFCATTNLPVVTYMYFGNGNKIIISNDTSTVTFWEPLFIAN